MKSKPRSLISNNNNNNKKHNRRLSSAWKTGRSMGDTGRRRRAVTVIDHLRSMGLTSPSSTARPIHSSSSTRGDATLAALHGAPQSTIRSAVALVPSGRASSLPPHRIGGRLLRALPRPPRSRGASLGATTGQTLHDGTLGAAQHRCPIDEPSQPRSCHESGAFLRATGAGGGRVLAIFIEIPIPWPSSHPIGTTTPAGALLEA
ncbi:hypothetical protein U9M48_023161 [Paspalum notatum var. saurae]|uniref:Uncharacterized protein n=1 Tax=Paspalum notatum var. saurae TaxID=547442 RepID=A0AAQ3TNG4_PASNO